jgi:endonuclease-3
VPAIVTRAEKAQRILAILDEYYPETPIPLDHRDEFELLVAVLLSAQTTDVAVNKVTPALFERAPGPEAMAAMTAEEILPFIRTLGLAPSKAKSLAGLARLLLERHGGEVPQTFPELEALPGVGHKTASVVMAQAFGMPAFPVDTHIHRLAARWGLSNGKSVEKTEADLKAVFPKSTWNAAHLQIIFFGREYCPALHHDMETCPICSWAATKKAKAENAKRTKAVKKKAAATRKAAAPKPAKPTAEKRVAGAGPKRKRPKPTT